MRAAPSAGPWGQRNLSPGPGLCGTERGCVGRALLQPAPSAWSDRQQREVEKARPCWAHRSFKARLCCRHSCNPVGSACDSDSRDFFLQRHSDHQCCRKTLEVVLSESPVFLRTGGAFRLKGSVPLFVTAEGRALSVLFLCWVWEVLGCLFFNLYTELLFLAIFKYPHEPIASPSSTFTKKKDKGKRSLLILSSARTHRTGYDFGSLLLLQWVEGSTIDYQGRQG